jgi:single-strand DNA-binding protein
MASYAKTIICGNLGRDPESRFLASGDAVCNFSVAVTESWKDKNSGEKNESTTWYRVNAFGKLAEICKQYLKKGSQVLIEGKMQCREWEKDGVKQYSWELKADQMMMLGGRQDGGASGQTDHGREKADGYAPNQDYSPKPNKPKPSFDDLGDDIPF